MGADASRFDCAGRALRAAEAFGELALGAGDAYGRGGTVKALHAFAEVLPQVRAL